MVKELEGSGSMISGMASVGMKRQVKVMNLLNSGEAEKTKHNFWE